MQTKHPDYQGIGPESGYHVARSQTYGALAFTRYFLENNDSKPAVARIKQYVKVYPYVQGGYGTSVASILAGKVPLSALRPTPEPPPMKFIEASGKAFNPIPANDYRFLEQINALVQEEPATSFDPELLGQMAASRYSSLRTPGGSPVCSPGPGNQTRANGLLKQVFAAAHTGCMEASPPPIPCDLQGLVALDCLYVDRLRL
jgi:hypothetical protein